MHPRNPHLYFFSPTGGTQRVAGLFAENLNAADACTDITVHAEAKTFSADDCLLVFFPVYGGRVPGPCLARMRALRGTDTPAVLVAVFGNRAVDDALLEMRDTLTPLGFRVIAAAEVIAPHSVNTDIAAGRPDAADRAKIEGFCTQLAARIAADAPAEIAVPGDPDYRAYNGLPLKPTGGLRCIRCGLCADNCPAGAIPKAAPQKVDKHKCISCLRCIQICPQSARGVPLPLRLAAAATVKNTAPGARSRNSTCNGKHRPGSDLLPGRRCSSAHSFPCERPLALRRRRKLSPRSRSRRTPSSHHRTAFSDQYWLQALLYYAEAAAKAVRNTGQAQKSVPLTSPACGRGHF